MKKREITKASVILFFVFLIATSTAYAEKTSGKGGTLLRADDITDFLQDKTTAILKADINDGRGRIYATIISQSEGNDKVVIKIDLRNPVIDYSKNQASGYATVSYKITNNGYFAVDPMPDGNGYFHNKRIGQKESINEKAVEHVTFTWEGNNVRISSGNFEHEGMIITSQSP